MHASTQLHNLPNLSPKTTIHPSIQANPANQLHRTAIKNSNPLSKTSYPSEEKPTTSPEKKHTQGKSDLSPYRSARLASPRRGGDGGGEGADASVGRAEGIRVVR
jgi:hypothetical protein